MRMSRLIQAWLLRRLPTRTEDVARVYEGTIQDG